MSQGKIEWPPVVGMLPLEELHPKKQIDPDLPLEVLLWLLVLLGLWKLGDNHSLGTKANLVACVLGRGSFLGASELTAGILPRDFFREQKYFIFRA